MSLNLYTLTTLLVTIANSQQICKLRATDMDRHWIYLTRPTANTWDILRTDYIRDQASLYLLCNDKTPVEQRFCDYDQLRERTNPNVTCPKHIRADIEMTSVDNSCRRLTGEMYNVVYNLPDGSKHLLYQVCYSTANEMAIFSRHKAFGFSLSASTYRRPMFSRGSVVSRERVLSFETQSVYNQFVRLLGQGQSFIFNNTSMILERGHLVNSQDFPSYDQMDETFKYINVVPQFRGSNRSNWKRIENWIHKVPAKDTYAEIVTGVYGILRLPHSVTQQLVNMYLMDNNKNPIPLWTYKVVKYNNICYAFVTLNNDFNTNHNIRTDICQPVACPDRLQFAAESGSTVAYCCNYNHLARYVGRHARLC